MSKFMKSEKEISDSPRRSARLMEIGCQNGNARNSRNLSVKINMLSTPTVSKSVKNLIINRGSHSKIANRTECEKTSTFSPSFNKENCSITPVTNMKMKKDPEETINCSDKGNKNEKKTVEVPIKTIEQNPVTEQNSFLNISKPLERTTELIISKSLKNCSSTSLQSEEIPPQQPNLLCHIKTISPNKEVSDIGHISIKTPENSMEIKFSNSCKSTETLKADNNENKEIQLENTFTLVESSIDLSQYTFELSSSKKITETSMEKYTNANEKETESFKIGAGDSGAITGNTNVNIPDVIETSSHLKELQEAISIHDSASSNNNEDKTKTITSIRISTSTPHNKPKNNNSFETKTPLTNRLKSTNEIISSPKITPIKVNLNNSIEKSIPQTEKSCLEKRKAKNINSSVILISSSDEEDNTNVFSPKKEEITVIAANPNVIANENGREENSENDGTKPTNSDNRETFTKSNPTITSSKEKWASFSRKRSFSVVETNSEKLKLKRHDKTQANNQRMVSHPSSSKVPNFSAMHKKQFEKMESIQDYVTRKANRAKVLNLQGNQTKEADNHKRETKVGNLLRIPTKSEKKEITTEARSKIPILVSKIGSCTGTIKEDEACRNNPQTSRNGKLNLDKPSKQLTRPTVFIFKASSKGSDQNTTKKDDQNLTKTRNRSKRFQELYNSKLAKNSKNRQEVVTGVRSNRRFELQMKCRQQKKP